MPTAMSACCPISCAPSTLSLATKPARPCVPCYYHDRGSLPWLPTSPRLHQLPFSFPFPCPPCCFLQPDVVTPCFSDCPLLAPLSCPARPRTPPSPSTHHCRPLNSPTHPCYSTCRHLICYIPTPAGAPGKHRPRCVRGGPVEWGWWGGLGGGGQRF